MSARVRVRFVGGVWDGYREMPTPLPRILRVPVPRRPAITMQAEAVPLFAVSSLDTYELQRFHDGTGIPSRAYRLVAMERDYAVHSPASPAPATPTERDDG